MQSFFKNCTLIIYLKHELWMIFNIKNSFIYNVIALFQAMYTAIFQLTVCELTMPLCGTKFSFLC